MCSCSGPPIPLQGLSLCRAMQIGISAHQKLDKLRAIAECMGYMSLPVFGDCFDEVTFLDPVMYPEAMKAFAASVRFLLCWHARTCRTCAWHVVRGDCPEVACADQTGMHHARCCPTVLPLLPMQHHAHARIERNGTPHGTNTFVKNKMLMVHAGLSQRPAQLWPHALLPPRRQNEP